MYNPRNFAIAIVLLAALAACSSPPPAATQAAPPTNTATPLPAATATEPPTPTFTPSPVPFQLEVLEFHRWTDVNGNALVEALVRNPYDFAVQVFDPKVALLNSAGEIVHRSSDVFFNVAADIGWGLILPDETVTANFCACAGYGITEVPEWESFQFVLDIEETEHAAYTTDLDVTLGSFKYSDRNSYYAQGTVTNTSGQPLRLAFVRVILRDANGAFIGGGIAGVIGDFVDGRYVSIEHGDSLDFTLPAYLDSALANERFQVEVSAIGVVAKE